MMSTPEAGSPVAALDDHRHHWRIQEQGTARSLGLCECGADRLFANGWEDLRDSQHGWSGQKPRRVVNQLP